MPVPFELVIEYIFFSPFLFFLLLLLFGLYSLKNNSNKFKKRDKVFFLLKSFSGLWILFLITSNVLFYKAAALPLKFLTPKSIKQDADAIVVASAGVLETGAPTDASTRRAHAAALLYLEKKAPLVIVTGGITDPYLPPSSIKGIPIILQGMGVKNEHIIIENRSSDTFQNGIETKKILEQQGLQSILLVSHDYHLFRLTSVFQKLGITVYPYSANSRELEASTPWWKFFDWENYNRLRTISHEYIGLINYKLSGKI